ncbi:MAG: hypothetical protein KGL39_40560 [Patescibacteria group bacterium]|nr:hypothetical protein [Patescibacteria group bacterium]
MALALVQEEQVERDQIDVRGGDTAPPRRQFVFPTGEVIATLTSIAAILGARLAVFMSIAAAFSLALIVAHNPTAGALIELAIFNITVFGSVTWLCASRHL